MSTSQKTIYSLLGIRPTPNYLTVLRCYIERINPNVDQLREELWLHFTLVNNATRHADYYQHVVNGQLEAYLSRHPIPQTMAQSNGQILSWVKAKIMEQELLKTPAYARAVEDEAATLALSYLTKTRFRPEHRRPPTRRTHEEADTKRTPGIA